MIKQDMEKELVRLQTINMKMDRLLRRCYYAVAQVHTIQRDKLIEELAQWRPKMPGSMRPQLMAGSIEAKNGGEE